MPGKNKKYISEDIENVISYKREGTSLLEPGKRYGVPRATVCVTFTINQTQKWARPINWGLSTNPSL